MSDSLRIGTQEDRTAFQPGEAIAGAVLWECAVAPKKATLYLRWSTRGSGLVDADVVSEISFADPKPGDTRTFDFRLPDAPYSFRGTNLSLGWTLGLVLEPGDHVATLDIVIAPAAQPVDLTARPLI